MRICGAVFMEKLFDFACIPRIRGTETLYYRGSGTSMSFHTYFNYIPYEKMKKYTNIYKTTIVGQSVYVQSKTVTPVHCAIIFCTYKRENFIKRNTGYLIENLKRQSDFSCRIIVIDNGQTLSAEDFDSEVILIRNINNGGSGGFKKGMEAAAEIGGFTHFILLDDDIEIDFVAVQKMLNFLRFLKPEYRDLAVAGSMLYLDKPTIQFEAGGHFGKDGQQQAFGHFLDLTKEKNLIINEAENDINYGGWWFMCMPFCCIEEGNYPMPFFLKYDDVEYGLRCGLKIITLNGVGVWHEKFETKYNSASEYYNTRNYLHLCAMYCEKFNAKRWVKRRIRAKENRQQYKMAEAVKLGYRDFRRGLEWLENLDAEENHRRICALNYEFISYDEIEKHIGIRPEDGRFYLPEMKKAAVFPGALAGKKYVFVDYFFDLPIQYFGAKIVVHCDSERNCGYITFRKKQENR